MILFALLVVGLSALAAENGAHEFDSAALNELARAYGDARQGQSSVWLNYKSCYIYLHRGGGEPSNLLASFDIDDTITKTKSGAFLPRNATDWQYLSENVKDRIQQTATAGRRLVLFTNQNGVKARIVSLESIKQRLEATVEGLDVPCTIFVAIGKDEFRKPQTGMYEMFRQAFNDNRQVGLDDSFYCGDAIGHPSFSDSDIKFALAIGLPFLTPQEFLHGDKPKRPSY